MVTWLPGHTSTIHNHGTWGIVALVGGQERNRLWRRVPHQGEVTKPNASSSFVGLRYR